MAKKERPLFWLGPILYQGGEHYDLFDMRFRVPVFDLFERNEIHFKALVPLDGMIGVGAYPSRYSKRLLSSQFSCLPSLRKILAPGDIAHVHFTAVADITFFMDCKFKGVEMKKLFTTDAQRRIAKRLRQKTEGIVLPGSLLRGATNA